MRRTSFLLPIARQAPADAVVASHQWMVRAGMIHQESAGIYSWLPLGLRVLDKIIGIVCAEHDKASVVQILMPTIQSADLWHESGRYQDYGPEMLRFQDRYKRDMLYGPTNEEMITALARSTIHSYRQLPMCLYQIQWKFRDEIRPRFGVMRGREFLMKDAYSFDMDAQGLETAYKKMFAVYMRIFARLGLQAIPVRASSGPIGGNISHEFHILAQTGESELFYDRRCQTQDLGDDFDLWRDIYAAEKNMHDPQALPPDQLCQARGIEVGHIFSFATKYSQAMKFSIMDAKGQSINPHMGSYGIGISRLPAAIIEACHDDKGIIWPASVAPFTVGLINLSSGDKACDTMAEQLYSQLGDAGIDTLYDDRDARAGSKFADMDVIGLPYRLTVSKRLMVDGQVEFKRRSEDMVKILSPSQAVDQMIDLVSGGG